MLINVLAVAGVLLFIVGFLIIFNRRNAVGAKAFEDDGTDAPELPENPGEPEPKPEDKTTEIFAAVDTSNTQEATGYGYDAAGESVVKDLAFEEKLGKDTVVVELPAPKARRKARPASRTTARPAAGKKESPVKLGATPEELARILERKIARRADILKVAKLSESGDATLKRYRKNLAEVKAKIAEAAPKKPAKERPQKVAVSSTEKAEVIRVTAPGVSLAEPATDTGKAVKKTTKKSTKKVTKKTTKARYTQSVAIDR